MTSWQSEWERVDRLAIWCHPGDMRGSCQVYIRRLWEPWKGGGEGEIPDGQRGDERNVPGVADQPGRSGAEAWLYVLLLVIRRRKPLRQDEWKMPKDTLVQPLREKKKKKVKGTCSTVQP